MEAPILFAGQRRPVTLDGVTYTLRALTYAEVSSIGLAVAGRPQPSQAVLADAVRRACAEMGRTDLAEAMDAFDAAQDALAALLSTSPSALDEAGQAEWRRENAAELRAAQAALARAERGRDVALYHAAGAGEVQRLRAELVEVAQVDTREVVAAGLVEIAGEPRTLTPAEVATLPAAHVIALAAELRRMNRPSESAAKKLIAALHLVRQPEAWAFGRRPPEGGWLETGEWGGHPVRWWANPTHLLAPAWRRVVDLWMRSRGGMGVGWLPEPGGVNAQPAWLLTAFALLGAEQGRLDRLASAKAED